MDSLGVFIPGQTVTVAFASTTPPTGGAGNTQISLNGAAFQDLPDPVSIGANHYSILVGGNFIGVPGFAVIRVVCGVNTVSLAMSVQPGANTIVTNTQKLVGTQLDDQNRVFEAMLREQVGGVTRQILQPILAALAQQKVQK